MPLLAVKTLVHISTSIVNGFLPGNEKVDSGRALVPTVIVKIVNADDFTDAVHKIRIISADSVV
jgi:hypothetical protein